MSNNKSTYKYKVHLTPSLSMCKFDFYLNNDDIGVINFHIEYSQVTIGWLCIKPYTGTYITGMDISKLVLNHRKGYGTKMLELFFKYIKERHKKVKSIVLIPEYFDGVNKNGLCNFYEKSGFHQETMGLPCYIKHL